MTNDDWRDLSPLIAGIVVAIGIAAMVFLGAGCAYKGGKIVDGSNICVGITIPGTDWTINALDYVGGVRVAGNDMTSITLTNEVDETNRFFGVVETHRHTKMSAEIVPCEK